MQSEPNKDQISVQCFPFSILKLHSMDSGLASLPVTELSEEILNSTDNKRYLNHEILINTLERYGVRETASEQIRIYF